MEVLMKIIMIAFKLGAIGSISLFLQTHATATEALCDSKSGNIVAHAYVIALPIFPLDELKEYVEFHRSAFERGSAVNQCFELVSNSVLKKGLPTDPKVDTRFNKRLTVLFKLDALNMLPEEIFKAFQAMFHDENTLAKELLWLAQVTAEGARGNWSLYDNPETWARVNLYHQRSTFETLYYSHYTQNIEFRRQSHLLAGIFETQIRKLALGDTAKSSDLIKPKTKSVSPYHQRLPRFPWPPPAFSSRTEIPRKFFTDEHRLGEVAETLERALEQAGHVEWSYYSVPNGFAFVTHLEKINDDGSPNIDRWASNVGLGREFRISDYIRALFMTPAGYFRIIVFTLTNELFAPTENVPSRKEAMGWVAKGGSGLPDEIKDLPFTEDYACNALIYEFVKSGAKDEADTIVPGRLPGRIHLEKSKVWTGLSQ